MPILEEPPIEGSEHTDAPFDYLNEDRSLHPNESPTHDPIEDNPVKQRLTQAQILQQSAAPDNPINEVGNKGWMERIKNLSGGQGKKDATKSAGKEGVKAATAKAAGTTAESVAKGAKAAAGAAEDPAGAIANQLKGRLGNGVVGKIADKAIGVAEDIARILAVLGGDLLELWPLLKKHWMKLAAIALILNLPALAIAVALGGLFGAKGTPAGGIAATGVYNGSTCSDMQSSLDITYNGKPVHLTLTGTTGKFSEESDVQPLGAANPGHLFPSSKNTVSFWGEAGVSQEQESAADVPWYITARWGWTAWAFNGNANPYIIPNLPPEAAYGGKKMIIFNPKNGKAVLGYALEGGPAPFTGTATGVPDNGYPGDGFDNAAFQQQKNLWNVNPPAATTGKPSANGIINYYRIADPTGFTGRIAGGSVTMEKALGTDNMSNIQFGFAPASWDTPSDTHPYGPLTCTVVNHGAAPNGGTGGNLNVPLVKEGTSGECGISSAIAVSLYYNPTWTDPKNFSTVNGLVTVNQNISTCKFGGYADYVNKVANSAGKSVNFVSAGFGTDTGNVGDNMEGVIQSVEGGDPVIMYTGPDAIYGSPQHIVVITGYDTTSNTFDIMSPSPGTPIEIPPGTSTYITNNNITMTAAYLKSKAGYPGHGQTSTFIINQKWTNP